MKTPGPGLIRNVMHLGVGQIVTTTLAILISAVVSRALGAADFGVLYLVAATAAFAYVFVDWGYAPYVTGEIARCPGRAGDLLGSALAIRTITAAAMCVVTVVAMAAAGYDRRTCGLAALQIVALLPQYLGFTYSWVFRGCERMDYDAAIQMVVKACTLVATLVCVALGGRVTALILTTAVAGAVTWSIAIVQYRRLGLSRLQVSAGTARELVRHGAPMMALSLAIAVQPAINANLLYRLAPSEVVGWFGVAYTIAGTLLAPAAILATIVYPRLSRATGDVREFRHVLHAGLRPLIAVAVLGGVGTLLFADFAIDLAYTADQFGEGARILQAFAPALVLIYLNMVLSYAAVARNQAGRLAALKALAVLTTTALAVVLIPWCQTRWSNGGIGVSLAIAAGEVVMALGIVALIRDILDRAVFLDLGRAVLAWTLTVVTMAVLPAMPALIGIPVVVAVFTLLSFALGVITRTEVQIIVAGVRGRRGGGAAAAAGTPSPSPAPVGGS